MTTLMRATLFAAATAAAALLAEPALSATVQPRPITSALGQTAALVDLVKQRGGIGRHHGGKDHGHRGRMGRGWGDSGEWYPYGWPVYGYACPRYLWTTDGWRCAGHYRAYGRPAVVIFGSSAGAW
jgi:hypothetical protein